MSLLGSVIGLAKKAFPVIATAVGVIKGVISRRSKDVGRSSSYDNETSSISETERINELLSSYSEDVSFEARKNEKKILRDINETYDEMLYKLQMDDVLDKTNIDRLKRDRNKIESLCRGGIEKHINKRFSIDDSECLEILKMSRGIRKENRMNEFSKNVMSEGIRILSNDIKKYVESDQDLIYSIIREKYNENNAKIIKEKKAYEEIIKLQEKDSNEMEDFIKSKEEKIKLAKLVIDNAKIGC